MDWDTFIRLLNVALGLTCLALLGRKYLKYWPEYQARTKDFWWVLFCWAAAITLGTLEVLLEWGTEFRVLFTLFALVLTIKLLLKPNEIKHPTFTNEF